MAASRPTSKQDTTCHRPAPAAGELLAAVRAAGPVPAAHPAARHSDSSAIHTGDQAPSLTPDPTHSTLAEFRAAAASHHRALTIYTDAGQLLGQARALNSLGELSARTGDSAQASTMPGPGAEASENHPAGVT